MTSGKDEDTNMDRVYEQYVKPLEREHWGEFVAMMPDGRYVLGNDMMQVVTQAIDEFGPGHYLFKVGPKVVGRWLTLFSPAQGRA